MERLHPSEVALLVHLARARQRKTLAAARALAEPEVAAAVEDRAAWLKLSDCIKAAGAEAEFRSVVSELLSAHTHTVLALLGGGTQLADTTLLTLTDDSGYELKPHIHEYWFEYQDNLGENEPETGTH